MNIYCDNYSVCNSYIPDQISEAAGISRARAKGWHVYNGTTLGGTPAHVRLCKRCVDGKRRDLAPAPELLPGQRTQVLFEVTFDELPDPQNSV